MVLHTRECDLLKSICVSCIRAFMAVVGQCMALTTCAYCHTGSAVMAPGQSNHCCFCCFNQDTNLYHSKVPVTPVFSSHRQTTKSCHLLHEPHCCYHHSDSSVQELQTPPSQDLSLTTQSEQTLYTALDAADKLAESNRESKSA